MDNLFHNPDKSTITREELITKLNEIMAKDSWIIDGNFQSTLELRLESCDTVFLLDIPLSECLSNIESRIGKKRSDMPWIEEEFDPTFKSIVEAFPKEKLPKIYELLDKYKDKNIIILRSRNEIDEYLNTLISMIK